MTPCDVRGKCLKLHKEAGHIKPGNPRYEYWCAFIVAGTVDGCPRRARLLDGKDREGDE